MNQIPARLLIGWISLFCLLVRGGFCFAEDPEFSLKPADTNSPRATLKCFIDSCNELYQIIESERFFDRTSKEYLHIAIRVVDCLDISELPRYEQLETAGEVAVCLKEILDRVEIPPWEEIPDVDQLTSPEGELTRWRIPGTRITIARVEDGERRLEYLFSPGTVERSISYYHDLKTLPYRTWGPETSPGFHDWFMTAPGHPLVAKVVDRLPNWTRERYWEIALWKWIGLILFAGIALTLMSVIYYFHMKWAGQLRQRSTWLYLSSILFPITAALVPLWFLDALHQYMTFRGSPLVAIGFGAYMISLLASLVVVFGLSNRIAELIISSPRINPEGLDAQFIRIMAKLLSIGAAVVIFLQGGQYLGIPLSTLLTSAGIGGLAVALAAQDTLRNVFGTIMLLTDKPFRVGERIIFGSYDGVVEEIGLRSTRLRLLTGHQATIPNDELARSDIENVGRRQHIRRIANIHLPLETAPEKLAAAVSIVRKHLENHEGMTEEFPPRVYLLDVLSDSFVIRMIYWYTPPNYWDYLAMSERLNLEVAREFEANGIRFRLPQKITPTDPLGNQQKLTVEVASLPTEVPLDQIPE